MNLHDEIERLAYEIYENNGRVGGRDLDNWLEAEHIISSRHGLQEGHITETVH